MANENGRHMLRCVTAVFVIYMLKLNMLLEVAKLQNEVGRLFAPLYL